MNQIAFKKLEKGSSEIKRNQGPFIGTIVLPEDLVSKEHNFFTQKSKALQKLAPPTDSYPKQMGRKNITEESAEDCSEREIWPENKNQIKKLLDKIEGNFDCVINNRLDELALPVVVSNEIASLGHSFQESEPGQTTDDDSSVSCESRIAAFCSEITSMNVKFYRSVPADHLNSIFLLRRDSTQSETFGSIGKRAVHNLEDIKSTIEVDSRFLSELAHQNFSSDLLQKKLVQRQLFIGKPMSNEVQTGVTSTSQHQAFDPCLITENIFSKKGPFDFAEILVDRAYVGQSLNVVSSTTAYVDIEAQLNKKSNAKVIHRQEAIIASRRLLQCTDSNVTCAGLNNFDLEKNLITSPTSINRDYVETIESMIRTGLVKFYDDKNGYGFLVTEDDPSLGEIFVHKRDLQKGKICLKLIRTVKDGAQIRVRFQIARYWHKKRESRKAVNLGLLEIFPVQHTHPK